MNRIRVALSFLCLSLVAAVGRAGAETISYSLNVPPSALQSGCFGPCVCPTVENPTYGSFDLVFLGSDPLYRYYSVERYIASFNNGPGAVAITGSGQYRIGGEVALTQQMTLDLQVWGGPVQHLDSGLVPVSTPFPKLHVACAVHGFACHDSVVVVDASPIGTAGVPSTEGIAGIRGVRPNPFEHAAAIVLGLDRAATVEVGVFDVHGSRVRRLGPVQLVGAGSRVLMWNGLRDDGSEARPGVYWVRMQWPGGVDERRIVKLD
jgi:hypothetical protein